MIRLSYHRRTRAALALVVAGLPILLALFATPGSTLVRAAPLAPAAPQAPAAPTVEGSAAATQVAARLRLVPPPNFPMATSPRCDILNNFGDYRSPTRTHQGVDILATKGQEVYAMADGTLTLQVFAGSGLHNSALSGNLWKLTAAVGGTYYVYAHLSAFAPGLAQGSLVYQGQVLGYVGDTGDAGAGNYHLHFELHPGGGVAVDPLPRLTVPVACKVWG